MKELHSNKKHYISGYNPIFKTLKCYSCRGHDWTVNKLLWTDIDHEIKILENGDFSLGCDCCGMEALRTIKSEVESLNINNLKAYGEGVSILFKGFHLECAKCGSEEFIKEINLDPIS